jgi:hypothetical protein
MYNRDIKNEIKQPGVMGHVFNSRPHACEIRAVTQVFTTTFFKNDSNMACAEEQLSRSLYRLTSF